jgi:acyl dehydratase
VVRYFEAIGAGETHDLGTYTADREELIAFARRYDPQPIHIDPDAAARTMFDGLIASGWHTAGSCMGLLAEGFLNDTASVGSFGLEELRWRTPVRPGDTISVAVEIPATHASESREDRGYIDVELHAENGDGEEVLFWDSTNIILTRAGSDAWPFGG